MPPGTTAVTIGDEIMWSTVRLALQNFQRWRARKGYYGNTLEHHLVGALGQVAFEVWAQGHGAHADSPFWHADRDAECDAILTGPRRVEVKTWSAGFWPDLGRCVAVGQIAAVRDKADLVVWATFDAASTAPVVELRGWSTIDEIGDTEPRKTGRDGRQKTNNHQLDEELIHAMDDLLIPAV